ncbi:MAG TPA: aspartate carbamoyltransferase catalytic subunit [Xanthomonadales bacterium]|nr:aspartate carbamoyltransferase catalytic subunit [Xanthomonadales bacterium]
MKHLTDIGDCSPKQLISILQLAANIAQDPDHLVDTLSGRLLVNLFYEASTRTRVSFEVAAKRLGMHVVNVSALGSSVEKGESLEDTFHTIQAMMPDCVVVRHPDQGTALKLAEIADPGIHVINAGDGIAAHPTQALLDALTLKQGFETLSEVRLVMAGDIRHSRVARSSIRLLTLLGIGEIRLCGPDGFVPPIAELADGNAPVTCHDKLEDAVKGANAIMMLRIQKERIIDVNVPGADEYHHKWGLRQEHLELAAPGCRVLHPGPMNRGVEIASEVADGPRSLIKTQVRNGLYVRMALLQKLLT